MFLSSADFFQNQMFRKIISGTPSDSVKQFGPDLGPNCLQRLSADDTRRYRVNCLQVIHEPAREILVLFCLFEVILYAFQSCWDVSWIEPVLSIRESDLIKDTTQWLWRGSNL